MGRSYHSLKRHSSEPLIDVVKKKIRKIDKQNGSKDLETSNQSGQPTDQRKEDDDDKLRTQLSYPGLQFHQQSQSAIDLEELEQKKETTGMELVNLESDIYEKEGDYIQRTTVFGNLVTGFDRAQITNHQAQMQQLVKKVSNLRLDRVSSSSPRLEDKMLETKVEEDQVFLWERMFSNSSMTSPTAKDAIKRIPFRNSLHSGEPEDDEIKKQELDDTIPSFNGRRASALEIGQPRFFKVRKNDKNKMVRQILPQREAFVIHKVSNIAHRVMMNK